MKTNNRWINSDRTNNIIQTNVHVKISQKSQIQGIRSCLNHEKEQFNSFLNQKILKKEDDKHFIYENKVLEQKEIKLRTSRDNTSTIEIDKTKQQNFEAKGNIKIEQIGNLLAEFKIKFAKIQEKYSLPVKSQNTLTFQKPRSPQTHSYQSRFDKISNNKFLNGYFTPTSKTTNIASNDKQTFTSVSQHTIWTSNNRNFDSLQPKTKALINKFDVSSPTADTRTQDKSRFRATYGPTKCNMIPVPIRKIKQAQQAISNRYNFSKCKDVESQTQDNDEQQTKQSIVIQKFSSAWRKLKRTQTLNQFAQQKCSPQNAQQSLKRMSSLGNV